MLPALSVFTEQQLKQVYDIHSMINDFEQCLLKTEKMGLNYLTVPILTNKSQSRFRYCHVKEE